MDLLPDELLHTLPPLFSHESETDPVVYIKVIWPPNIVYVTEGAKVSGDFIFGGYESGSEEGWCYFALSKLSGQVAQFGSHIRRESDFLPLPLSQAIAQHRSRL